MMDALGNQIRRLRLRAGDVIVVENSETAANLAQVESPDGNPHPIVIAPDGVWSIRRTRMEDHETYAWQIPGNLVCGECGWNVDTFFDVVSHRPAFACGNVICSRLHKIYVLGEESKVAVFDTQRVTTIPPVFRPNRTAPVFTGVQAAAIDNLNDLAEGIQRNGRAAEGMYTAGDTNTITTNARP